MSEITPTTVVLVVVALVFLFNAIVILPESHAGAVFRLGRFLRVVKSGVNFRIPFIDLVKKVDLNKEIPEWKRLSPKAFDSAVETVVSGTSRTLSAHTGKNSSSAPDVKVSAEAEKISNWLLATASAELGVDLKQDPLAGKRIAEASQAALEDLQTAESCEISLPFIYADQKGPKHFSYILQSSKVQEIVSG
ncbi:MAG: Hsp70 family protein [Bdellovibrionales bacterium]|nr:Hsp70 family protein [Bdellovibrionales bacterium]